MPLRAVSGLPAQAEAGAGGDGAARAAELDQADARVPAVHGAPGAPVWG